MQLIATLGIAAVSAIALFLVLGVTSTTLALADEPYPPGFIGMSSTDGDVDYLPPAEMGRESHREQVLGQAPASDPEPIDASPVGVEFPGVSVDPAEESGFVTWWGDPVWLLPVVACGVRHELLLESAKAPAPRSYGTSNTIVRELHHPDARVLHRLLLRDNGRVLHEVEIVRPNRINTITRFSHGNHVGDACVEQVWRRDGDTNVLVSKTMHFPDGISVTVDMLSGQNGRKIVYSMSHRDSDLRARIFTRDVTFPLSNGVKISLVSDEDGVQFSATE